MKSTILFITLPNLIESTNHRINNHAELTSHPQLMIEGAFSHAPFDGTSYGFRTKSARYVIPDIDGSNHGQSTWVDIAMCCAATPLSGLSSRDDAHGEAFAPPLANRCLSYQEHASGVTYKDGINPKGINKSPCAAQNVGFYHDLTRDDYHPRHGACCAWFKTFLNDAWTEYPDLKSKNIIDRLNDDGKKKKKKNKTNRNRVLLKKHVDLYQYFIQYPIHTQRITTPNLFFFFSFLNVSFLISFAFFFFSLVYVVLCIYNR